MGIDMKFCTAVNCMDGRVQLPVIEYLKKKFRVDFVDMITEAGPNRVLADHDNKSIVGSILFRIKISVEKHGSKHIAIIGHHDCAGNPSGRDEQKLDTQIAVNFVRERMNDSEVIGLWVDENWEVNEI